MMMQSAKSLVDKYFPALNHKNFRYFWFGQIVSQIGVWMQNIGQAWLVYTLTDSPLLLGLVTTLQFLPILLFSLFAGVLIDITPKKRLLLITQSASMVLAFALAILVWTGWVQYWHVLILATLTGFVNTVDMPTRQSFVVEITSKKDLMNAVAMNSMVMTSTRIIGPALAGILMSSLGIAFCFFANALGFIPAIFSLTRINVVSSVKPRSSESIMKEIFNVNVFRGIKEGLVYIFNSKVLFRTLLAGAIVTMFMMNFNVLIPVFARSVLGQDEKGFSFLMSIMGVGSFTGAITLAITSKKGPQKLHQYFGPVIATIFYMVIGFNRSFALTAILLICSGFFLLSFAATNNSTLQIHAKDEFRGRVSSVYTLVSMGSTPIGSLFVGAVSSRFGGGWGYTGSGLACLILFLTAMGLTRKMKDKSVDTISAVQ